MSKPFYRMDIDDQANPWEYEVDKNTNSIWPLKKDLNILGWQVNRLAIFDGDVKIYW